MNDDPVKKELEMLFKEPLSSVYLRENNTFDEQVSPFEGSLVLFGAGGLGKKTLEGLRRIGIEPLAFADNNPLLWGKEVNGVRVLSVEAAAKKFGKTAAFVITIWKGEALDTMAERKQQLINLDCRKIIPFGFLFWKYPDIFIPHYAFDLPHKVYENADQVQNAFSLWADESSRAEYLAQLRWRMLLDFDGLHRPVDHEIYFPDDLVSIMTGEVFIDCGAYDGDTTRKLLGLYATSVKRVIAFEPDPKNFQRLQQYATKLPPEINGNVVVHQLAVGIHNSKVRFNASGTEASSVGSGDIEVNCVSLDDILVNQKPTYIKMDIEGSEMNALHGAQNIIKNNLPVLAICSYHRQEDLWQIPTLIRSFSDQYYFFLRPHLLEVWDLVCYAIPANRLRIKQ